MGGADTIFVGGAVLRHGTSRRGGVALREGRIALVGSDDDVRAMAGPATEVVDVAGGLVTPGFQDAHAHPLAAGVDLLRRDLTDSASAQDTVARIAAYASGHPDVPWILGSGWSMAHFPAGIPTREALDAIEAALARCGRSDRRHHVAHLQIVAPADVPRFAALGASATIQPLWAAHEPQMDELTIPFLGDERAALQYPFGDLVAAGAHLAAGSDWPVSSPNPSWAHVAVNRVLPHAHGAEAEPFYARNRIDLATALRAYTGGSAYVNHLDDVTGRLETGLLADLAVLDRDPFAGPADEIGSTRVVATYVEGRSVFRAGSG